MLIICNVLSHDLGILYLQIQFPAMIILSQQWPLFQDLEMGRCYTVNVSCTPGQWLGWIGDLEATKGSSLLPLLQFKNHYGCIFVIYFMHICVYLHVSVCTMCVCLQKSAENTGSLQTGVLDDCEKLCGCWELDLGPLLEQQVPLPAESSLQSHPSSVFDESVFKKSLLHS